MKKTIECPEKKMALVSWDECKKCPALDASVSAIYDHCYIKMVLDEQQRKKQANKNIREYLSS